MHSIMHCVFEWLVACSEDCFRTHRSKMVDVQGSITSRSQIHTKKSPNFPCQKSSQTSWSGEQPLQCLKCQSHSADARARPLSQVDQHFTLVGGFISQGQHSGSSHKRVFSLVRQYHFHLESVPFVNMNGVKISHSRRSPSTHGNHQLWRLTTVSSSTKVIHRLRLRQPSWSKMRRS